LRQVWQIYEPSFLARLETLFRYLHILLLSFGSFYVFCDLISPFRTEFCLFFRAGRGKPSQASAGAGASATAAGGAASTAAASEQEDAFIEGVRRRVFGGRGVCGGLLRLFRLCLRVCGFGPDYMFSSCVSVAYETQVPLSDAQLQLFVMLHADDGDA
jgi:hypothetical protein